MSERLTPLDHLRRAALIGREVLLGLLDRVDTRYADRINPPEEWPRIYVEAEAPVATEEELGGVA